MASTAASPSMPLQTRPMQAHRAGPQRAASIAAPSATRTRRSSTAVRAEKKDPPRLSFKANDRAALGFTDADSAGQTNIFAVEPKTYVAGSSADDGSNSSLFAIGAFFVAATVLAGAVTFLNDTTVADNLGTYKSLGEYRTEFAGELASAPSL